MVGKEKQKLSNIGVGASGILEDREPFIDKLERRNREFRKKADYQIFFVIISLIIKILFIIALLIWLFS
jgi:hypothetical protein